MLFSKILEFQNSKISKLFIINFENLHIIMYQWLFNDYI